MVSLTQIDPRPCLKTNRPSLYLTEPEAYRKAKQNSHRLSTPGRSIRQTVLCFA
jgi:hypothetical protein